MWADLVLPVQSCWMGPEVLVQHRNKGLQETVLRHLLLAYPVISG